MSTNYHEVLIANIVIGERFRVEYGDMDGLKRSIEKFGLLEPIVLDRENNLLAGGRRVRAYAELGRERIPALYIDEVDDVLAREIELEENIQRENLTWQEVADLTKEIHELKTRKYAGQMAPAREDISSGPFMSDEERQKSTEAGRKFRILPPLPHNSGLEENRNPAG